MENPKFIKQDDFSKSIDALIASENEKRSCDALSESFDSSRITECPRRLYYRSIGNVSQNKISYLEFKHQQFAKKKWLDVLGHSNKVKIVDANVEVADCNYNLTGKIDVILKCDSEIMLLNIYSLKAEDFEEVKEKGAYKKHAVEIIVNRWLVEKGESLLIYENRNNSDYIVFHIDLYNYIVEAIKKKCLMLLSHKFRGRTPSRSYKTNFSKECNNCEFSNECWK